MILGNKKFDYFASLVMHVLYEDSLGPASKFAAYLSSLPRSVDLPLIWSPQVSALPLRLLSIQYHSAGRATCAVLT